MKNFLYWNVVHREILQIQNFFDGRNQLQVLKQGSFQEKQEKVQKYTNIELGVGSQEK